MRLAHNFLSKLEANRQYKLGIKEYKKGRIDNALKLFDKALEKFGEHLPSLYSRGSLYIDLLRWDKALNDLEKVKDLDSLAKNINFLVGICNAGLGNYNKALVLLESQISRTPDLTEAYWNKALVLKNIGQNEKALSDIDNAIYISKRIPKLYCIKAEILENLKRFEEAEECYDQAIKIEKRPGDSLLHKVNYLKRNNKIEEAIMGMDQMIEEHPFNAIFFFKRAELKQANGDINAAKKDYESALNHGLAEAKEKLKNIA